jgi:hypothetical protein
MIALSRLPSRHCHPHRGHTYVDDNLTFSNCETMRHQFAAHCNKRVRFNDKGPTRWYLDTQRARPNHGSCKCLTRTVHQQTTRTLAHVRVQSDQDTLIRQAGRDSNTSPIGACHSRSSPAARLQGAHRQPTLSPNRHDPRDQLDRIRPRTIHDQSRRATHGRFEKGTAIPSISQENTSSMVRYRQRAARHYPRLRRRFLRRHPGHPLVLHRLRLPRQRRRHLFALYQNAPCRY